MKKIKAEKQSQFSYHVSKPLLGFGVPSKQSKNKKTTTRKSKSETNSKG